MSEADVTMEEWSWHDRVINEICNARLAPIIRELRVLESHHLLEGRNVSIAAVRGVVELLSDHLATLRVY